MKWTSTEIRVIIKVQVYHIQLTRSSLWTVMLAIDMIICLTPYYINIEILYTYAKQLTLAQ